MALIKYCTECGVSFEVPDGKGRKLTRCPEHTPRKTARNATGNRALVCVSCSEPFEAPVRRGRPPSQCDGCRTPAQTERLPERLSGADAVDKLERMLRSRGTHINQEAS